MASNGKSAHIGSPERS
ncbi:hypothetical protein SAMN05660473_03101 [Arthrobacter sp. 49Tsu3.1M3]|nr:hypothetical protein SAMN05660473_03101 [Arthrobacter sp. 49Tsu3.1M3]